MGAAQAEYLRQVYGLVQELRAEIAAFKPTFAAGGGETAWARMGPAEVSSLEDQEVAAALGVSRFAAAKLVDQAITLVEILPRTLDALAAGTLDMARVRVLVDATLNLSAEAVREVEDAALAETGAGPWEGPSVQAFKARVRRAVVRVQTATAEEEVASVAQETRLWVELDRSQAGLAMLKVCGPTQDIVWLRRTLADLAETRPSTDPRGEHISSGRREVAALFDLVERAVLGEDAGGGEAEDAAGGTAGSTPGRPSRPEPGRSRELGLVLHADTFFGRGPAAGDPGEFRGFGVPIPVGAGPARSQAIRAVKSGAPTCVLLAGADGTLQRLVRVGAAPPAGWTPGTLADAVRRALAKSAANESATGGAALATDRYTPTTAIADHVRAYYPTCTAPTCNRSARSCDLDHDEPGPADPPPRRT